MTDPSYFRGSTYLHLGLNKPENDGDGDEAGDAAAVDAHIVMSLASDGEDNTVAGDEPEGREPPSCRPRSFGQVKGMRIEESL